MTALLKRLLSIDGCESVYQKAQRLGDGSFDTRVLRTLDITVDAPRGDIDRIPSAGPLLIVANHPHGAIDGLALSTLTRQVRPDVRVLANGMLSAIPELADLCFFVDPFDGPDAAARSLAGLRAAHLWLRRGGALVVFPSGEVAHRPAAGGSYAESPWLPMTARLAAATGATVVPAFIEGRNSRWFYAAGRLHRRLRTALLARELMNARGSTIHVRLGSAMAPSTLVESSEATTLMFRAVETLRTRPAVSLLESEIEALAPECCLVDEGSFQVFCTRSDAIPAALQEIGRLRAETYHDVGDGTGSALDLDSFDERYLHLFVWDRRERLIVGAYRIGETDRIAADQGVEGLYTRKLFRYDARLLDRLPPALELGRSFVRKEYQRSYSALLLLWKGIGRFVALHPRYRILFGPVSVGARHSNHSRQLLMSFLEANHRDADLALLIEALNPPPPPSEFTSAAEPDLPVLLRQYLKLNAKVIGFSVDAGFGGVLDALMLVDLAKVDPSILGRYMEREGATAFLERHRLAVHGALSPAA